LARCDLNIEHQKFKYLIGSDTDLHAGLQELKRKVAQDHRLSGWFNQPMKHCPEFQNRIWKWDFAPAGATSATRKGWRLYAYVPDPRAQEPIPATAFFCYPKSADRGGDYSKAIADALKEFLKKIEVKATPDRFKHQIDGKGRTISLCYECYEKVAHSEDLLEIEIAESAHQCAG
jgi:hypothetical protein